MYLRGNEGSGTTYYTVTGNSIINPDGTGFRVLFEAGSSAGDSTNVHFDFGGTDARGQHFTAGGSPADIGVARDFAASNLTLKDYTGGDIQTYFRSRNFDNPTVILSNLTPSGSTTALPLPTTPPLPLQFAG